MSDFRNVLRAKARFAFIQPVQNIVWSLQVIGWCQVIQGAIQTVRIIPLNILNDQMHGILKVCHGRHTCARSHNYTLVESFYSAIALRMVGPVQTIADVSLPQVGLELNRNVLAATVCDQAWSGGGRRQLGQSPLKYKSASRKSPISTEPLHARATIASGWCYRTQQDTNTIKSQTGKPEVLWQ